jgi:hypothetical protein
MSGFESRHESLFEKVNQGGQHIFPDLGNAPGHRENDHEKRDEIGMVIHGKILGISSAFHQP